MDDVLVAVFVGNGHLALQDEVDLLQRVVVVGPVSTAVGLELGHTDPELLGAGLVLAVVALAGHAKMTGGEIGLQLFISTLDHLKSAPSYVSICRKPMR